MSVEVDIGPYRQRDEFSTIVASFKIFGSLPTEILTTTRCTVHWDGVSIVRIVSLLESTNWSQKLINSSYLNNRVCVCICICVVYNTFVSSFSNPGTISLQTFYMPKSSVIILWKLSFSLWSFRQSTDDHHTFLIHSMSSLLKSCSHFSSLCASLLNILCHTKTHMHDTYFHSLVEAF